MTRYILFTALAISFQLAFAQKKDAAPKASTFNNNSKGQQNNNTGSGKQTINNNTIKNTIIKNPEKVNVTVYKKVDTQVTYITPNDEKIYLLDRKTLFPILERPSFELMEFTFGNPDSNATRNINFKLDFNKSYDSAYIKILGHDYGKPFDPVNKNSAVRDTRYLYSSDKKSVTFQAAYLAAKNIIKVYVITTRNFDDRITFISITGAGKLF
jgi:hypothetical protein